MISGCSAIMTPINVTLEASRNASLPFNITVKLLPEDSYMDSCPISTPTEGSITFLEGERRKSGNVPLPPPSSNCGQARQYYKLELHSPDSNKVKIETDGQKISVVVQC